MFKTGSKFLFGLAAFGFVAAIAYAGATGHHQIGLASLIGPLTFGYKGYVGEHVGYSLLMGLSFASLFGGILLSALRDADAEAVAEVAGVETVPETPTPSATNYWPVVGAFSCGLIVLGLAVGATLFTIGLLGLSIVAIEWAVRAWSDRATGDPEVNRSIRDRFLQPVEIPALALLIIIGMVLAVSRILLALPKNGSYVVFGLVPAILVGIGALLAMKPKISQSVIAAMLVVGGLAVLAGGVAAAIHGEREHEGGHEEKTEHGESGLAPLPSPSQTVIRVGN
ncbi:MAG: hypothetical protein ABIP03_03620 [Aquihabitans sp.]